MGGGAMVQVVEVVVMVDMMAVVTMVVVEMAV